MQGPLTEIEQLPGERLQERGIVLLLAGCRRPQRERHGIAHAPRPRGQRG